MRIDIPAACREAIGIWRRDREPIIAVAGFFFFLPNLALGLFMAAGDPARTVDPDNRAALMDVAQSYLLDNAHWLVMQAVAELIGIGVLLVLLLDPARPTVGAALRTVFRRLPLLIAVSFLVNIAKAIGILAFILPGLLVIGRTFVMLPVLLAEPDRRFGASMQRALAMTQGQVVPLVALSGLLYFSAQFVVLVLSGTAGAASSGGGNPVTMAMLAAAVSLVGAAMSVAFTLVRATVYRRLASNG